MGDIWILFINKINKFNIFLIKYMSLLFKNIQYGGKRFSKKSLEQIEHRKNKWDLKQSQEKLGAHVYKCHTEDKTLNFSNDDNFHKIIKEIKDNKSLLENEKND